MTVQAHESAAPSLIAESVVYNGTSTVDNYNRAVEDVIRMEGTAAVEKTDYGWHLQYEAVNCEDEKSAIRSDVKLETATRRAILVNEGEGYGLLLDPAAVTATQIKTPQGSLTLNVKTKEVTWDLAGQKDGSVILEYMLLVGMQPVSALRVSLFLKKI